MPAAIAVATVNSILDAIFNATAYSVATPYVSLHNSDPGATGAGEITGGSYARQLGSFAAASAGSVASDADIDFTDMPAVTVTDTGIWTAVSAGTFVWAGALTASKAVGAGDTFRFPSGNLTASIS